MGYKTFSEDSAPSHGFNLTQTSIQRNISSFINKDVWPARSSDLNPSDFSIWSILETRVLATPKTSLVSFKAKLQKEWEEIPQEQIPTACHPFVNRLEAVVCNKGGCIEKMQHGIVYLLFTLEFQTLKSKLRIRIFTNQPKSSLT
ncbi:hypothetical protein FHG87_019273 [Trinorchestia longiramus]|nr:hypothetical protein FHG87_019273 [Trinorchestia longiramus]